MNGYPEGYCSPMSRLNLNRRQWEDIHAADLKKAEFSRKKAERCLRQYANHLMTCQTCLGNPEIFPVFPSGLA